MKTRRAKVLFVCIGNSCRSPMAEAIARQDALQEIEASSAGLAPQPISAEAWESADVVINMSGRAREFAFRNFTGHAKAEDWQIEDPYGDAEKYQGTYEAVQRRVTELAQRIRKEFATRDDGKDDARRGARS